MRSTASAVIERGGVLRSVLSGPPLTIRRVRSDDDQVCRLCLVNSAAGPLSGDEVGLELTVGVDARAEVTAAGAAIAQGRAGAQPGRLITRVTIGTNAQLCAQPAPLIVCEGANVAVQTHLELAESAAVRWQETIVLGRFGESAGAASVLWSVARAGAPVLRQTVDLTSPTRAAWPGMLAGRRVLLTSLISDPGYRATSLVLDPTAVRQRIDEHTVLITVLDDDAALAARRLSALLPP